MSGADVRWRTLSRPTAANCWRTVRALVFHPKDCSTSRSRTLARANGVRPGIGISADHSYRPSHLAPFHARKTWPSPTRASRLGDVRLGAVGSPDHGSD